MAHFKTTDDMWEYMTGRAWNHTHEFRGHRIYDDAANEGEDAQGERAMRKTLHLIIEHGGEDGETIKMGLGISYRQGYIWKGENSWRI